MSQNSSAAIAEAVAGELGFDIMLGRLEPTTRLVEDELMARFSVKRHVVRSALDLLVARGQAERRPNAGVAVKAFTSKEVRDLYATRILLESNAALSIALPVPEENLRAIELAKNEHAAAVAESAPRRIIAANEQFHIAVYALLDNRVLAEAIRQHAQRASPIRFRTVEAPEQMARSVHEHAAIVDALRGTDSAELARLCEEHLKPTLNNYLTVATHDPEEE